MQSGSVTQQQYNDNTGRSNLLQYVTTNQLGTLKNTWQRLVGDDTK